MLTKILSDEKDFIVCHKPAGLPTQTADFRQQDMMDELHAHYGSGYLGLVHRLDQPVEGILLVAKNEKTAALLTKQLQNGIVKKAYLAVTAKNNGDDNFLEQNVLKDYLIKNEKTNLSSVTEASTKGAKYAELFYRTISKTQTLSLREVKINTGRHHQIRVQLANAGIPILGDQKYGNAVSQQLSVENNVKNVALCAYQLSFRHPNTGKEISFEITPSDSVYHIFDGV